MFPIHRPLSFVRHTLALTAVFGACVAVASAQTSQANPGTTPQTDVSGAANVQAKPALDLTLPVADADMFSSSSTSNDEPTQVASNADHFNFVNAMQYGGHGRYGRPRYRGGNTNADGSPKWAFVVGGGFTNPLYDTADWNKISWSFKGGAGRNFNKMFGLLAEYNYDNFGLTGGNIAHQAALYTALTGVSFSQLDGNAHAWSLTLNPIVHLVDSDTTGVYIVGGGGFYRKLTNFTYPSTQYGCGSFYCGYFTENATIDHYSNNAGGLNGGLGFTYKFSRFSGEKLFAEARYTWIANSQSQNSVGGLYPQNNFRTTYVPVTVGLRW